MSSRRMVVLQVGFLMVAVFAHATTQNSPIRITILDSETRSVSIGGSDVPKNCDQVNFDAYCNNSRSAILTNTLLVQEGNEPPFRISCTIYSRYSRCIPLAKGETFDAKIEKRGLTVYYVDDKARRESSCTRWSIKIWTARLVHRQLRWRLQRSRPDRSRTGAGHLLLLGFRWLEDYSR